MSTFMVWFLRILPFVEPAIHAIASNVESASLPNATKQSIAVNAAIAAGQVASAGLSANGDAPDAATSSALSTVLAHTVDATVADLKTQGTLGQVAAVTDTALQAATQVAAALAK